MHTQIGIQGSAGFSIRFHLSPNLQDLTVLLIRTFKQSIIQLFFLICTVFTILMYITDRYKIHHGTAQLENYWSSAASMTCFSVLADNCPSPVVNSIHRLDPSNHLSLHLPPPLHNLDSTTLPSMPHLHGNLLTTGVSGYSLIHLLYTRTSIKAVSLMSHSLLNTIVREISQFDGNASDP